MKSNLKKTVAVIAVTAMTAMPIATGASLLTADTAQAKGNNGQGKGNGGQGSGRGQGRGGADAAERGGPPEGRGQGRANARGAAAAEEDSGKPGRGAISSALGFLNAAHASPTGRANAAPNSMPGKLYTYEQTGGIALTDIQNIGSTKDEIEAAEDELQAKEDARADAVAKREAAQSELDGLETIADDEEALETYDGPDEGTDPDFVDGDGNFDQDTYDAAVSDLETEISDLNTEIDTLNTEIGDLETEISDAQDIVEAYEALGAIGDGRGLRLTASQLEELNRLLDLDPS